MAARSFVPHPASSSSPPLSAADPPYIILDQSEDEEEEEEEEAETMPGPSRWNGGDDGADPSFQPSDSDDDNRKGIDYTLSGVFSLI